MPERHRSEAPQDLPEELVSPRSFIHYLGASWRLWKPSSKRLLPAFFVVILLISVGIGLAGYLTAPVTGGGATARALLIGYLPLLVLSLGTSVLAGYASPVIAARTVGTPVSWGAARTSVRPVRSHLVAAAMIGATLSFGLAVVLAPFGVLIGPLLFLGPPILAQAIALEGSTLAEGSNRLRALLTGNTARVLIYLVCAAFIFGLVQVMVGTLIAAASVNLAGAAAIFAYQPLNAVVAAFTYSFMSAFTVVTYLELRSRAGDLERSDLVPARIDGPNDGPDREGEDAGSS